MGTEVVFSSSDDGLLEERLTRAYIGTGRKASHVLILSPSGGRELADSEGDDDAEEVFL